MPPEIPRPSVSLVAAFVVLPVLVAAAFPIMLHRAEQALGRPARARAVAVRAAIAAAAWLAVTGALAATGRVTFEGMPPTAAFLGPVVLVLGIAIGTSSVGGALAHGVPLAALVGLQAFRFPLELAMHRAYTEGLMPVQMSYSGRNLDIVTGITALLLAPLIARGRVPRAVVHAWNAMGTALLVNVVTVAVLSTPTPLRVFHNEPANVWIAQWPFVWLPTVLVLAALIGHIVVFRALRMHASHGVPRSSGERPSPQT